MKNFLLLLTLILLLLFNHIESSKVFARGKRGIKKTSDNQVSTAYLDINNIKALQQNNGNSDFNLNSTLDGLEWPKGSGKCDVFESGLLWGGYVPGDPQVRVGGSTYRSGLEPGPIMSNGYAADPNDPRWSIYRVRRDVYPGGPVVDLSNEAQLEGTTQTALRNQYEKDWDQWPATGTSNDLGAPYTDVNNDGKYEPDIDIPGVPGADQTIYFVANDEDSVLTKYLYGALPLGIELHATYWAYSQTGALDNIYFKKYLLINKGYEKNTIDSMFISFWADPDVGDLNDDYAGTDTNSNMIYAYNGTSHDANYSPEVPPSVGFSLLQGPTVSGNYTDTAIFKGRILLGKKNLPMTASYFFINGDMYFGDPPLGQPMGSTQFYNFFNGKYGLSGAPFRDPMGSITKFVFTGDPVTGIGWMENPVFPPADIRQGMVSGPFNLAPGDTQEVVIAEIVGQGSDYLHSINTVKSYKYEAYNTYKNLINKYNISAPPNPVFSLTNNNNSIQIQWDNSSESFDNSGYSFEGYNVYQLSTPYLFKDNAKLIATFDKADGVKTIYGPVYDPETGLLKNQAQQFGTDSGLKYNLAPSEDYINNAQFIKGKNYYYAVTAYAFNPDPVTYQTNTESRLEIKTVSFNRDLPGPNYGDQINVTHTSGQSDGTVDVTIADPSKLTGDKYQVTFHNEIYSLGNDGKWTDITAASKKLHKTKDLTGSSIFATASWIEKKGEFEIHFLADIESPNIDWCNGIEIFLPSNITIDSIYKPRSNNDGSEIDYTYNKANNSIFYGDSSRNSNGLFAGGEDIILTSHTANLPMVIHYNMYDDNFGTANGYGGVLLDVSGTDTVTAIQNVMITQKQWNVKDVTTGNTVLSNQTILNGEDIYAPQLYFESHKINGPGGSTGSYSPYIEPSANVVFDGLQVAVNGSYDAPTTFGKVIINGTEIGISAGEYTTSKYGISDFTIFGNPDGTAAYSLPLYGGAGGTTSINQLQQDYELKWTGVEGDTTINGHTVVITKSGGQIATIFGASNYSFGDHPLNPNPGSTDPFTIRIPFEVWNTTKNEQINLLVYDRNYIKTNDPTKDGFQVWDQTDRVYVWAVNTKYTTSVINPNSTIVADSATWNWVFFSSIFTTGDDILINYINPIQISEDIYTFNSQSITNSLSQRNKVIKEFSLSQNYPNPFNPTTTIIYTIPKSSHVTIKLYDILGRLVSTLVDAEKTAGTYNIQLSASYYRLASGVYFYRMQAGNFVQTKKLLLLK